MATVLERVDPSAVLVALALMGLDIVLGIAGAVKEKDVQSSKMREGQIGRASCRERVSF